MVMFTTSHIWRNLPIWVLLRLNEHSDNWKNEFLSYAALRGNAYEIRLVSGELYVTK